LIEIIDIRARYILDSRGNPTVEVDVETDYGFGRAAVPSGASTGKFEACELRDGKKDFKGKSVYKALANVEEKILPELIGLDALDQRGIDELLIQLDGTANKKKLGANAILGVSLATARAAAQALELPLYRHLGGTNAHILPVPSMNVINGGAHAGNQIDIQEFMIQPVGAKTFSEAVQMCAETYHTLKDLLKKKYGPGAVNVGDEGGFAPNMKKIEEPLDMIVKAISKAGYTKKIKIALDCAASEFYDGKKKKYMVSGKAYSSKELIDVYKRMARKYPIISIEDPFDEEDWKAFADITKEMGDKVQIVGDDLLVTNTKRLTKGIKMGACNALLLKVNQIGTVSESIDAAEMSFKNKWGVMVSHRSGETEDNFIADLTVALGTGQLKSGAPCRSDRNAKYNQLLRIEEDLGPVAQYGAGALKPGY
jgi:enolase